MSTLVIFGASGDLTRRKLIPALFALHRKKRLPDGMRVMGVSRTEYDDDAWRESLWRALQESKSAADPEQWREFAQRLHYFPADLGDDEALQRLQQRLSSDESPEATRIYYLATLPRLYKEAIEQFGRCGMADQSQGSRRIVIEKPFGVDLATAQALNSVAHSVFEESQIYRIDHYLGKETVQNMIVLRFANSIFEPIWNRNYIDHVQITVAEEHDVGTRGDYYDGSGVLRDMFQNHLLQLMMITAMEAPLKYDAHQVRDEKVKVLRAIRAMTPEEIAVDTLRGQYQGYRGAQGVPSDSQTATFAAMKLSVDNWRWKGVPFYLRSGKAMSCRTTQIVVQFHSPPHLMFDAKACPEANRLVIQIQPAEGVQLHLQTKRPDAGMQLRTTDLEFSFRSQFSGDLPDAYQRLLMDAMAGDASLFARSDEVEYAWRIVDPILQAWSADQAPPLYLYPSGDWGPTESTQWMRDQGREWFDACPVIH